MCVGKKTLVRWTLVPADEPFSFVSNRIMPLLGMHVCVMACGSYFCTPHIISTDNRSEVRSLNVAARLHT